MKTASRFAVLAALLGLAGCLEVEQGLQVQKDLSGSATVQMVIDMEGIVHFAAKMQHDMMGKPGEPTEQELEAARADLMKKQEQQQAERDAEFEQKRAKMQETLPAGVTLGETTVTHEGLRTTVRMSFTFDHVSKLAQIEFPSEEDEVGPGGPQEDGGAPDEGGPGGEGQAEEEEPMKRPFEGLVVEETGDRVRITFRPQNPAAQQEAQTAEMPPEMKDIAASMMKGVRYELRIQSPMPVVEQNATRVEGDAAIWVWDLDGLKQLQGDATPAPTVVFNKE